MVLLCLTGTSSSQPRESPFFVLGKVIMQQSYVCALIAMMVTTRITNQHLLRCIYTDTKRTLLPHCAGLEHHVPQLADFCASTLGLSHLDPAHKVLLLILLMLYHEATTKTGNQNFVVMVLNFSSWTSVTVTIAHVLSFQCFTSVVSGLYYWVKKTWINLEVMIILLSACWRGLRYTDNDNPPPKFSHIYQPLSTEWSCSYCQNWFKHLICIIVLHDRVTFFEYHGLIMFYCSLLARFAGGPFGFSMEAVVSFRVKMAQTFEVEMIIIVGLYYYCTC